MNLLKGITEELKGSSESTQASDPEQSTTTSGRSRERRDATSTATASEAESEHRPGERTRDDEHVCTFCGTDFAASRGACPDCGAELIMRGERSY